MKFRKLIAGLTAAAIAANMGVVSFAESGAVLAAGDSSALASVGVNGYLAQLTSADSDYNFNLRQVFGDTDITDAAALNFTVEGEGTAVVSLIYNSSDGENLSKSLGVLSKDNTSFDLTDKTVPHGENGRYGYEYDVTHSISICVSLEDNSDPLSIKGFSIADSSSVTLGGLSADTVDGIQWQDNFLSESFSLGTADDRHSLYTITNSQMRKSLSDASAGELMKISYSTTDTSKGNGFVSVYPYFGEWQSVNLEESGVIYVRVTEHMAETGIEFGGWNVTIDSVQFGSAKSDSRTVEKVLFEGSMEMAGSDSSEDTASSELTFERVNVREGDILHVECEQLSAESNGSFTVFDGGWNTICASGYMGGWKQISGISEYEVTLTESDAASIRNNGFKIYGSKIVLKKLVLCSEEDRADLADSPLMTLYYNDGEDAPEYWIHGTRYGIGEDKSTVYIYTSGMGTFKLCGNDDNGARKDLAYETVSSDCIRVDDCPSDFCVVGTSGIISVEKIGFADSADQQQEIVDSTFFRSINGSLSAGDYDGMTVDSDSWNVGVTSKYMKEWGLTPGNAVLEVVAHSQDTDSTGGTINICVPSGYWNGDWTENGNAFYWTVNEEMYDRGFALSSPDGLVIDSVSFAKRDGSEYNYAPGTVQSELFNGELAFTEIVNGTDSDGNPSTDCSTWSSPQFMNFHDGDILRIYYKDAADNSWVHVMVGDSEFTNADGSENNIYYNGSWAGLECVDIPVSSADISGLYSDGFHIDGVGFTLTRVEVVSDSSVVTDSNLCVLQKNDGDTYDPDYSVLASRYGQEIWDKTVLVRVNVRGDGVCSLNWGDRFWQATDEQSDNPFPVVTVDRVSGSSTIEGAPTHRDTRGEDFWITVTDGRIIISSIELLDESGNVLLTITGDTFSNYEPVYTFLSEDGKTKLDWDGSIHYSARELKAIGARAGDALKLNIEEVENENGDMGSNVSVAPYTEEASTTWIDNGEIFWVLSQDMIDKGIVLRGTGLVTDVSLCTVGGENRDPVYENTQWSFVDEPVKLVQQDNGDLTSISLGTEGYIWHDGDIVRISFTVDDPDDNYLSLQSADYGNLENKDVSLGSFMNCWASMGSLDVIMSGGDLETMKKVGLALCGMGVTVSGLEIISDTRPQPMSRIADIYESSDPNYSNYDITPSLFMDNYADVAYVEADVYGGGWGNIVHNTADGKWINGREEDASDPDSSGAYRMGTEVWKIVLGSEPLTEGSKIVIQDYSGHGLVYEVRFYSADNTLLFKLDPDNASENYTAFAEVSSGNDFRINTEHFLGGKYGELTEMTITTNGKAPWTVIYTNTSGTEVSSSVTGTSFSLKKSELGNDVIRISSEGTVALISVAFYNDSGCMKQLDYRTVGDNEVLPTSICTIRKDEKYTINPRVVLTDEQFAKLSSVSVRTSGTGGGALSWMQWDENAENSSGTKGDYKWVPAPSEGSYNAGGWWAGSPKLDANMSNISVNCWWDEVTIYQVNFNDEDGNVIYSYDGDSQPRAFAVVEKKVDDDTLADPYIINVDALLAKTGSALTAGDIGRVELVTIGDGGVNLGRVENGEWVNSGYVSAGDALSIDVSLTAGNSALTIQNWSNIDDFGLISVTLYDNSGNKVVCIDSRNAYILSDEKPLFQGTGDEENDKFEGIYIYPESILGADLGRVASVDIESYGDENGIFRAYNNGDNGDRRFRVGGWDSMSVSLEEGCSVIYLESGVGSLIVMSVVFRDADGNALATLNGGNSEKLNVPSSSTRVLAELRDDLGWEEGRNYYLHVKSLLGENFGRLDHISAEVKGFGLGALGWNDDHSQWTQYSNTCEGGNTVWTAFGKPSEAHSTINIADWWMYQSVLSVTFYDADGNILFKLTPENEYLNTPEVDGTDYITFSFDNFELDSAADNGSLWFEKIRFTEGCSVWVEVLIPADISDDNPSTLSIPTYEMANGRINNLFSFKIGSGYNSGSEHLSRFGCSGITSKEAEWLNDNGLYITGTKLKVVNVTIGKVENPKNITATPTDGGVRLSWDPVPGATAYRVFRFIDRYNSEAVSDLLTDSEFTISGLEKDTEYRFYIEAHKKDIESPYVNYANAFIVYNGENPIDVVGHSLSLGDSIGVKFYTRIGDSVLADPTAKIRFTVNGRETLVPVSAGVKTAYGYMFTCPVAASEMNECITMQLYIGGQARANEFTYSVKTYADYIMADPRTYADEYPLVYLMLNYGAAAELYFSGYTDLDFVAPSLDAEKLANYEYSVSDNDVAIDFVGQLISLDSKVAAKLYFTGKDFAVSDFAVTQNGAAVDASRLAVGTDDNGTYLAIYGIDADKMGQPITVTAGGVTVSNYSVYSYILEVIRSEDKGTTLYDVCAALYYYGDTAALYSSRS